MEDIDLDAQRRELMRAALHHIPFDGWSWAALTAAAEDCGLDAVDARNAFPEGPVGAIELFSLEADDAMLAAMEDYDLARMRVRDRVATAIRIRLEQNEPHKEAIRRALSTLAMPGNAALSTRALYRTVDAVWAAAGDSSVDVNFYSKRALLAGVYSSTLLYWLDDHSADHGATRAFLDRRIDEVLKIGGRLGKSIKQLQQLPDRLRRLVPETPRRGRNITDLER